MWRACQRRSLASAEPRTGAPAAPASSASEASSASSGAGSPSQYQDSHRSSRMRANPIGEDRKRMGFIVVADVSSENSFTVAYAIVDKIFERLQFDVSDSMTCPVAIVIVGNKSDLRGSRREAAPEAELRADIYNRYYNRAAEPRHSVEYVECSAQTNVGLEQVMVTALHRINMQKRVAIAVPCAVAPRHIRVIPLRERTLANRYLL